MTAGERWAAKAYDRLASYCKTRGFRISAPTRVEKRASFTAPPYIEVDILDDNGRCASLAVAYCSGMFLDDNGLELDDISTDMFNLLTAGLERRPKPDKRQLTLFT